MNGSWCWVRFIIVRRSSGAIRRTGVGIFTLMFPLSILLAAVCMGLAIRMLVFRASTSRRAHLGLDGMGMGRLTVLLAVGAGCRVHLALAVVRRLA